MRRVLHASSEVRFLQHGRPQRDQFAEAIAFFTPAPGPSVSARRLLRWTEDQKDQPQRQGDPDAAEDAEGGREAEGHEEGPHRDGGVNASAAAEDGARRDGPGEAGDFGEVVEAGGRTTVFAGFSSRSAK
jgi:hypothetical protein